MQARGMPEHRHEPLPGTTSLHPLCPDTELPLGPKSSGFAWLFPMSLITLQTLPLWVFLLQLKEQ